MIIKLYFVISLCESEDNMVPTISDTNPGHGPGLESGDHSDRGTSHRTPVVQVSRDIPRVMSTPNHNFRPCRGPSKLHYNLSTDDEEIEACPVTQGGRDKARHGAGIRWERDITYSPVRNFIVYKSDCIQGAPSTLSLLIFTMHSKSLM